MKVISEMKKISLVLSISLFISVISFAQDATPAPTPQKRDRITGNPKAEVKPTPVEIAKTDTPTENVSNNKVVDSAKQPQTSDNKTEVVTPETQTKQEDPQAKKEDPKQIRQESLSEEEAAIIPYYNNYLIEYHLGPEDVISVDVFGQPNYSKGGITISPTAKISYPLIGAVFVGGKTTEQVENEIKKKLEEYIINPQVTVTLDKVGSARYSVLGKVGIPGVKLMTRRYSVYEAVVEAGGFAKDADQQRVMLIRSNAQGGFSSSIINFKELLSGKTKMEYLAPGDQIFIPEKKWSLTKVLDIIGKASAFRLLFGSPF